MSGIRAALIAAAGGFVFTANITADRANFNLRTEAVAAGWNEIVPLVAQVNISSGFVVFGNSTAVFAFDTGTTDYPAGSSLTVNSAGAFIVGMGGAGSTGAGGNGGGAVRVNLPTTWDNASGTIGGGGGGGGGGQTRTTNFGDAKNPAIRTGTGGVGGGGRTGRTNSSPNGTFSSAGAGAPGSTQTSGSFSITGGTGGAGGGWGTGGASGGVGSQSTGIPSSTSGPFGGGAAGAAIVGNANITWLNVGTRLGSIT